MRKGQNPARMDLPAYQPEKVGVAILVFIPHQTGYFEDSLQVLELQIDSLQANTAQPFNLLVLDNGSCAEVKQTLEAWHASGKIDWLLSSRHNLGKTGALNWILGAMPNDYIVYSDSDVFFRPGWLEASLKIVEAFPKAGMVAAQPCFYDVLKGEGIAQRELDEAAYQRFDHSPSQDTIVEYVTSIGYADELIQRYSSTPLPAVRTLSGGVEAVVGASHMEFLIPREVARSILPLPVSRGLFPQETQSIDRRVDAAGFQHLSALDSLVLHMGNVYDPILRAALNPAQPQAVQVKPQRSQPSGKKKLLARIAKNPVLRPLFYRLYKGLFAIFSES